jgi:hypothetical protein
VSPAAPAPGSNIRAQLTDQGSAGVTSTLGPGVTEIGGLLLERDESVMSVLVAYYVNRRQGEVSGDNAPIRLPLDQIAEVKQKRLSRGRSVLLGAAFVGGALIVGRIVTSDDRVFEPQDPDDPGPIGIVAPAVRWPWLRLRFP